MKKLSELQNIDVRKTAKSKNVMLYEVAAALNISEPTMTRRLRSELPQEEKERIFKIIDEIAAEKAAAAPSVTAAPLSQAV